MTTKRLVICADGTWNDPEDKYPTNVLRVARAIRPEDDDGVQQVVFYDWGIGSYYAKVRGGVSGLGLMKNVQDCYRFIVHNYDAGDDIFLFGFSRGAYTVRALGGFLNKCGILQRGNAEMIPDAFAFYKKNSIKPGSEEAQAWRREHSVRSGSGYRGIVRFVGVWDTVGALGIPTRVLAFVDQNDLFYDVEIGTNVKAARHAVAIDEKREDFEPTLWSAKEAVSMKQVWFAGVHGDVGGGCKPREGKLLSDIPLAWMAREAEEHGLSFEPHLRQSLLEDHTAGAHRSYKRFYKLLGAKVREIPEDSAVHSSVRSRYEGQKKQPEPLRNWLIANDGWGPIEE